ncbi:hypothetical protein JOF46_003397 [Paeniglutamicibacter psychrophenolicus]|uniref:Uncharacterized protein n=1 Tax=Paeniglutamicibacter psychrophenolicus TaxID=257454 RepID=A0ABS4WH01_9MICC|nr:hypothetical protein [Paeniglutamicibacter psychrophenolicus]
MRLGAPTGSAWFLGGLPAHRAGSPPKYFAGAGRIRLSRADAYSEAGHYRESLALESGPPAPEPRALM